MPRCDLYLIRV